MAYTIGITGGSGSGKTTFIGELQKRFSREELCVLTQDHYYKPLQHQETDSQGLVNFDLPESIDMAKFKHDFECLRSGKGIRIPEYTFNNPHKKSTFLTVNPAEILVAEGLFVFEDVGLNQSFDLKIFMDADDDIKYQRRLLRDARERGLSETDIHYQWHNHVVPSFEKFLFPHKSMVDFIILNNSHFAGSLNVLVNHLNAVLRKG